MNPERMKQRGINFAKREWAVLKGWRLVFNKIAYRNPKEGYANIVKDEKGTVEGVLYDVLEEDIKKLDRYECYPIHYNKITVKVNLKNGKEIDAITYIAQPDKIKDGLKPDREYLNHLLKGNDLLSEKYCERLKTWENLY